MTSPASDPQKPSGPSHEQPKAGQPPVASGPESKPTSPDEVLPPVEAPSAGFILQLFLIPMIIVSIIVVICLLFNWLAELGTDPRRYIRDIRRLHEGSWQKAFSLTNLLRDPKHKYLKVDEELAGELVKILEEELEKPTDQQSRIHLRVFLCKALGEFEVDTGLTALVQAAGPKKYPLEIDVRYAAVESLALLAFNIGSDAFLKDPKTVQVLVETSQEQTDSGEAKMKNAFGELRSAAAYALGVIGGDVANRRLEVMLGDVHPNARYNAATGLARHGKVAALDTLLAMISPDNKDVIRNELKGQHERKRSLVITNGIRGLSELARAVDDKSVRQKIADALRKLETSEDVPRAIRIKAKESAIEIDELPAK